MYAISLVWLIAVVLAVTVATVPCPDCPPGFVCTKAGTCVQPTKYSTTAFVQGIDTFVVQTDPTFGAAAREAILIATTVSIAIVLAVIWRTVAAVRNKGYTQLPNTPGREFLV